MVATLIGLNGPVVVDRVEVVLNHVIAHVPILCHQETVMIVNILDQILKLVRAIHTHVRVSITLLTK